MQAHFMATGLGRATLLVDDRHLGQQRVFWELQLVAGDEKCKENTLPPFALE